MFSSRFTGLAFVFASLVYANDVAAADDSDLLPVDQAFHLDAKALDHDTLQLTWKIADGYYLYRDRIKTKSVDANTTLGLFDLPAGEKKHDEFLGDVEVYHHSLNAIQHVTAAADQDRLALEVRFQGCHEVDPKICFPPYKTTLNILLPATSSAATADNPLTAVSGISKTAAPVFGSINTLPLPPEQAFVFEAIATGPSEILARWTMPKGYYLYRDKSSFSVADNSGATLGSPRWPAGINHADANFGETIVYFDQVEVPVPINRKNTSATKLDLHTEFQGCLDHGVCYPVMARTVNVELPAAAATATTSAPTSTIAVDLTTQSPALSATTNTDLSPEQALAARLSDSRLLALLSFFGFGLLLAFTPCVFPMIPILSGIIAGAGEHISTKRAFTLSLVYILASSVIFTVAGVVAGLAGKNLQAAFQTPWILCSFAGLFVLLSLSMFGFYELQLPSTWQSKIANVSNRQQGGSLAGVAVMGMLSALIVGPCVAPPLAAAVLYISQTHDPVFGGLALFVLSLGMGAPLIVAGTAAGQLLPRAGAWMDAVKAVFGVTFLALAIWMLSRVLDASWIMLLTGALAVGSAVYLGALERLPEGASGWRTLWKAFGILLLILGAAELLGAAAGANDPLQPLRGLTAHVDGAGQSAPGLVFRRIKSVADFERELAAAHGKPVLLDFYADWCVSCKEMEKFTFSKPEVRTATVGFILLQADVTANDDSDQTLMQHFGIIAPPDTLFFINGKEKRALRLTGPEDADKFVQRMTSVTN